MRAALSSAGSTCRRRGSKTHSATSGSPPELVRAWSELCQPSPEVPATFKAVYPYLTTVLGNRFQFRGGDKDSMKANLQKLFEKSLKRPLKVKVEA